MPTFYVTVEYREQGAIGAYAREILRYVTEDAAAAANMARGELYSRKREHVHIRRVEDSEGRSLQFEMGR